MNNTLFKLLFKKFWEKLREHWLAELGSIALATIVIEICRLSHIMNEYQGAVVTFLIIFLHYFILKLIILYKGTAIDTTVASFEENVRNSSKIFVTSIVPDMLPSFERRFHPDLMYQLSILAGKYTKATSAIINKDIVYVLIFSNENILNDLKAPYFDGHYAKGFSKIFRELGFNLAYMTEKEFLSLCSIETKYGYDIKFYDFALLDISGSNILYEPEESVRSSIMKYKRITTVNRINNRKEISEKIIAEIFESGSSSILKSDYDFIKYTCSP